MEKQAEEDIDMDADARAKFFKREYFDWADDVAEADTDGEESVIITGENVRSRSL